MKRELEYSTEAPRLGAISRRAFLSRSAALGASASLVSSPLGAVDACAAATVKKGGVLRLGVAGGDATDGFEPGATATRR